MKCLRFNIETCVLDIVENFDSTTPINQGDMLWDIKHLASFAALCDDLPSTTAKKLNVQHRLNKLWVEQRQTDYGQSIFAKKDLKPRCFQTPYLGLHSHQGDLQDFNVSLAGVYNLELNRKTQAIITSPQNLGLSHSAQHLSGMGVTDESDNPIDSAKPNLVTVRMSLTITLEDILPVSKHLNPEFINYFLRDSFSIKLPIIMLENNFQIKSGQILGYDYGYQYWFDLKTGFAIFDENGKTIKKIAILESIVGWSKSSYNLAENLPSKNYWVIENDHSEI